MGTREHDKYSKMLSLIMLGFVLVVGWIILPLFAPLWRWTQFSFEDVAIVHNIPVEQLSQAQSRDFHFLPRAKGDPMPWVMLVRNEEETPAWVKDAKGKKPDEYQTLVRVELINDRTGESPSVLLKGGTQWDGWYQAQCWRLPATALGRSHTRPIVMVNGGTWQAWDLGKAKSWIPIMRSRLRRGEWIRDDDPDMGFDWRHDPFGDKVLNGELLEDEEPEEEGAEGESAEASAE
ncbi:MAG: hypothetical protein PF961_21510 [Planctomycetota bacterium]|jgi:hypothetical protein|nr:hypothetical protein [Planctomycetota bacterium]